MFLSKSLYHLLSFGQIVDWDVNHQHKKKQSCTHVMSRQTVVCLRLSIVFEQMIGYT